MKSYRYILVDWTHDFPEEPIRLLSEIDVEGWEIRKVEEFRDGRLGYASHGESAGGTKLGEVPLPSNEVISRDPEFRLSVISKEEFDAVWNRRGFKS